MITVEYPINTSSLLNACLFYMRSKPFLRNLRYLLQAMTSLLILMISLKILLGGITIKEGMTLIACSLWLFMGSSFTQWRLARKMKREQLEGKTIRIDITDNGVIWKGAGLISSSMPWSLCNKVFEINNGFIFPTSYARFLWLPFSGFKSGDIEIFRQYIQQRNLPLIKKKITC